jgi:hypothetical protein
MGLGYILGDFFTKKHPVTLSETKFLPPKVIDQHRVARFFLAQYTKTRENILNYHNITK